MDIQDLRRRITRLGMRWWSGRGRAVPGDPLPPVGVFRVLICRLSHSLGNTLLITPLLREIEAIWPGAEIDIVTRNPVARELFSGYACVRDVVTLPRRGLQHPVALLRCLRRLGRAQYDLAIDTDPRSQSGRALLLRSRARYKLGFADARKSGTISHTVDAASAPRHNGHFPVHLLRAALRRPSGTYPELDLRLDRWEKERGAQMLSRVIAQSDPRRGRRGVIGVFANATGAKLLSRAWWQEFMPAVDAHFADYCIVEIVPMSAQSMLDSRYPTYYSSDLRKLGAVLSQLSLLICLDCGIMHLARASGTRTAAIFTQTQTAEWGPYGEGATVIEAAALSATETARDVVALLTPDALDELPNERLPLWPAPAGRGTVIPL